MSIVKDGDWTKNTNSYKDNPERAFARALHYCAMDGFDAHQEAIDKAFKVSKKKGSSVMVGLYTEYLMLFLHLLNRKAFEMFGSNNVSKIRSAILPYIVENAQLYYKGDAKSVAQSLVVLTNDRERNYAQCVYWVPPESPKGLSSFDDMKSTNYLFMKYINSVLGRSHSNPLENILTSSETLAGLMSFFSFINLSEWLKGPAMNLGIAEYENINLAPPGIKPLKN
jgi:hypothetical protein